MLLCFNCSVLEMMFKKMRVLSLSLLLLGSCLLCCSALPSVESWPLRLSHSREDETEALCSVGTGVRSRLRLAGHVEQSVWAAVHVQPSIWWKADLPEPLLLSGEMDEITLTMEWRLLAEPYLHAHNVSASLVLPDVHVVLALSRTDLVASPLRLIRPDKDPPSVTVRLHQPRTSVLRYALAILVGCLIGAVVYSVSARRMDGIDETLARRLEHEEKMVNVTPDAVVGGVRIFSTKGKVIKRFGGKK